MKKSQRMKPIAAVAESGEQQAAIALGGAQSELQSRIARMAELKNYLAEYQQRFTVSGAGGFTVLQLQNFRSFLSNLRLAIDQQKPLVDDAVALVREKRDQWFKCRNKVKIYEKMMVRYRSEEDKVEERQEQVVLDELAQRRRNVIRDS